MLRCHYSRPHKHDRQSTRLAIEKREAVLTITRGARWAVSVVNGNEHIYVVIKGLKGGLCNFTSLHADNQSRENVG